MLWIVPGLPWRCDTNVCAFGRDLSRHAVLCRVHVYGMLANGTRVVCSLGDGGDGVVHQWSFTRSAQAQHIVAAQGGHYLSYRLELLRGRVYGLIDSRFGKTYDLEIWRLS